MADKDFKDVVIAQPIGGWAYNNSNTIPVEGANGQYSQSTNINVKRANFIGHITAGETTTAVSDAGLNVNAVPVNASVDSTGNGWAALDNARLVKFQTSGSPATLANYNPSFASGTHNGHTPNVTGTSFPAGMANDVLVFKDKKSTPQEVILWSWNDGTDADVSLIKSDGTGETDAWFSSLSGSGVLTAGVPHRLTVGSDANIYITNKEYIAYASLVTGGSGDITSTSSANVVANTQALFLGAGWIATDIKPYGNYLMIIGYKNTAYLTGYAKGQSRMWLWDYTIPGANATSNFIYEVPDYFASALLVDNGQAKIFTQGRDGKVRIKLFGGINYIGVMGFQNIFEYPSTGVGNAPLPGSVDMYLSTIVWGQNGANNFLNQLGDGFHQPYGWTGATVQTLGMIKDLGNSIGLAMGMKRGSNYTIEYLNSANSYPNAIWYSALQAIPYKSTIREIKILFSQFATSSSLDVGLWQDYTTSAFGGANDLLTLNGVRTVNTTNYPRAIADQVAVFHVNFPRVNAFYMGLRFSHVNVTDTPAVVRGIIITYELID